MAVFSATTHFAKPRRVCMITHSIYERDTRVRRYAEYLVRDGFLVDVIALRPEDERTVLHPPGIHVYHIPRRRVRREGLSQAFEWVLTAFLMFIYATALDIRYGYDLMHVHNMPDFLVFCAILPRLRGVPVILNVHDPAPEVAMSKLGVTNSHPVVVLNRLSEKISIRFSSHVMTATPVFRDILVGRSVPPEKVTVIMNAPSSIFCRREGSQPEHRSGFTLLYVGTIAKRYGLDILVRALAILRPRIPGVRLRVLPKIRGEGEGLRESLELADDLGVRELIELSDPAPLEEMPEIMRQADLGVYPARRDIHMDIALSLKIPEMVNVGLCVVSSRLTVLEDLYGGDAIAFVPPEDPEALADKILELYHSPEERERLVANALERSKDFTWKNQYKKYLEVVKQLVS
ncbi:MAG: glycosyltransferase family 4 protein [Desulfomonile sp.]|nr:glycosyltransferase family 4 protein [Desulfomonile sp.]